MEHRDRLEEPPEAVRIGEERVGQIAEILGVDTVVRVEISDDDLGRVEAEAYEPPEQPAPAVRHRRALADHDARLEGVQDMEEVEELVAEQPAKPGDVLSPLEVG